MLQDHCWLQVAFAWLGGRLHDVAGSTDCVRVPASSLRLRGCGVPSCLPTCHRDGRTSFSPWARKLPTSHVAVLSLLTVLCGIQVTGAAAAWCHTKVQHNSCTTSLLAPPARPQFPVSQAFCLSPSDGLSGSLAMVMCHALSSDKSCPQPLPPSSLPRDASCPCLWAGLTPRKRGCRVPSAPPQTAY